jgi:hypothetical protein
VLVDGNVFGVAPDGVTARIGTLGVGLQSAARNVRIGQRAPNHLARNVIGVLSTAANSTGNVWSGNLFLTNSALGVDLGPNGVTTNDSDDVDAGANGLQNFPQLTAAYPFEGGLRVEGMLDVPAAAFNQRTTLSFYNSASCDPGGFGEGSVFLASVDVALSQGAEALLLKLAASATPGSVLTAMASGPEGSSEFSACLPVGTGTTVFANGLE